MSGAIFSPSIVLSEIEQMFESRTFSDATIECCGKLFPVHKFWLCSRSEYFRAAFENNSKESLTSVLKLEHNDPLIVENLLEFIYFDNYTDFESGTEALMLHAKMYEAAKQYLLPELSGLAFDAFERVFEECLADEDNSQLIRQIYETFTDPLSEVRKATAKMTARKILFSDIFKASEKALREVPGFACDVMAAYISHGCVPSQR